MILTFQITHSGFSKTEHPRIIRAQFDWNAIYVQITRHFLHEREEKLLKGSILTILLPLFCNILKTIQGTRFGKPVVS
ncbi:hypothetical protein NQ318_019753 [Aromia moschata]|uniref:Uncharacterized protein n=1 Tax=Aromia moschata TaxID=1265417 RepID=A0AAV8XCY6_9CUCU|nr:hypothetical protein NQ318_019753 [Aromia moschata]